MTDFSTSKIILVSFVLLASLPLSSSGQITGQAQSSIPNLFLDCNRCYESYLKESINIVNFVRNKDVAQIHLLVTREETGNGAEWTLKFIGREEFLGNNNTITFFSSNTDTFQEERVEFTRHVKIGLIPFISQTTLLEYIGVNYEDFTIDTTAQSLNDPWNHWVFEIEGDVSFDGEEQQSSFELEGALSATRITNEWKIELEADGSYERNHFELDSTETLTVKRNQKRFDALIVKSLTPHWSLGGEAFISSSTFSNIALKTGLSPAVEFNIFPYSEYNRHEFSFLYEIIPTYVQYNDTTIFDETEQYLIEQELRINYELTETWGGIEASLNGSAYLHDLSKNRLDIRTEIDLRIYRGLSLFIFGNYSLINDQISLPKGGATTREELLRLQELATGYEYRVGFGLSFTFGSIYNNIVNPRFDRGRGGGDD